MQFRARHTTFLEFCRVVVVNSRCASAGPSSVVDARDSKCRPRAAWQVDGAVILVVGRVVNFLGLSDRERLVDWPNRHVPCVEDVDVELHSTGQLLGIVALAARKSKLPFCG